MRREIKLYGHTFGAQLFLFSYGSREKKCNCVLPFSGFVVGLRNVLALRGASIQIDVEENNVKYFCIQLCLSPNRCEGQSCCTVVRISFTFDGATFGRSNEPAVGLKCR